MQAKPKFSILYIFLVLWLFIIARDLMELNRNFETIPYSDFLTDIQQGKIAEVEIGTQRIDGLFKTAPTGHPKNFTTVKVDDPTLPAKLAAAHIKYSGVAEDTFWRTLGSWIIPAVIMVGLWALLFRRMSQSSRGGFLSLGKSKAKVFVEKGIRTRFEDVAGVQEAKADLSEIVSFLRNPAEHSKLGARMPKGVLLVGPPGTGKTLLARAVAGEAGVPFFSINGSEFVELFVGLGAARVRDLFQEARANAPCIIFIDELDALGKARGIAAITGSGNDEKEQTLNQLLAEMDGFDPTQGIVLLAATNRPEVLDPALLRAGRFDRQIMVEKPDRNGRAKILEVHLKHIKLAPVVDIDTIASLTVGFSGADLANLVNEAALVATRRNATEVQARDFTEAIERIVAGLERRDRLMNTDEKKRVAYHEMGHTVVALAFGKSEVVHKVSIIPRSIGSLGYTFRRPTEDRYLMERHELKDKLAIALGGRAAETIFFDDISTGASDDLDKATEIARAMVTNYGMSEKLGLATFERQTSPLLGGTYLTHTHEFSEQTAQQIDREVKGLLDDAFEAAHDVLELHRAFIDRCAGILLTQETLDEAELKMLWLENTQAQAQTQAQIAQIPVARSA